MHQGHMTDLTSGFAPALNNALQSLQALGLPDLSAKAAVTRAMTGQAYLLASVDMFTASAWLCVLAIGAVWLCHRTKPHGVMSLVE
jgi:DHA2 family multidrug resistance protein